MTAKALSPQEERVIRGDRIGLTTKEAKVKRLRVHKMLDGFRDLPPRIAVDRARLVTESFRTTEGLPVVRRWAEALKHVAQHIPVHINENELIVGRGGPPGRYMIIYPELLSTGWLARLAEQALQGGDIPFILTDEDAAVIQQELVPYWTGRTLHDAFLNALPNETQNFLYRHDRALGVITPTGTSRSSLAWCLDYDKVLKRGFSGIQKEAEDKIASLDPFSPNNSFDKLPFYQAVVTVCQAMEIFAKRYAELAKGLAKKEKSRKRAKELLEIADRCERVPMNPARDFREAVQAQWLTQCFSRFEQNTGGVIGNGRIDQYLYPFYKKDIDQGRITNDQVLELLECLWLNMAQSVISATRRGGGVPHFEHTTIGGQNGDGKDAANALSYLLLQSKKEFPLDFPDLSVRVHSQTPDVFLMKVCELIKEGTGFPKLLNDEEIIPLFLAKGASLAEALDYCGAGCTETKLINRDTYFNGGSGVNLGAIVEMALNQGRLRSQGDEPVGVPTPSPVDCRTFDDLWNLFQTQVENAMLHVFVTQAVLDTVKPRFIASPQLSSLHDLCMAQGRDIFAGKLENGIALGNFSANGFGTAIDSLAAIKKLVYDDKKLSMSDLLEALDCNFEGQEALRQMCLNAPKYGNNDPYADAIGRKIEELFADLTHRFTTPLGAKLELVYVPIVEHVTSGRRTGATPNGRKAGEALSEGVSPTQGCDVNGLTTTLLSIAKTKAARFQERASRLVNIKISPQVLAGEEGTKNLASLIRAWCDMKFWHIQFNIINSDTLRDAKQNPDKYRNLCVRVAGYSAYFVDLDPRLQDEIIARTEHQGM